MPGYLNLLKATVWGCIVSIEMNLQGMSNSDTVTQFLAAWGALLSTFLAGFRMLEFFETRVRLVVRISRDMKVHPKTTEYGDKTYIVITVANPGHRPVFVEKAGLIVRRKRDNKAGGFISPESMRGSNEPLTEGMSREFLMDQAEVEDKYRLRPDEYVAFVNDRAGRQFYSHNWIQRLIRVHRLR